MGRPTKLTTDTFNKIIQAIRMGTTYEMAANYSGVSYDAFNNWRKRGNKELARRESEKVKKGSKQWQKEQIFVEFVKALKEAEGQAVVGWLAKIEQSANEGNWQAAAWKLERRYPADYNRNRTEHTGKDGDNITIKLVYPED